MKPKYETTEKYSAVTPLDSRACGISNLSKRITSSKVHLLYSEHLTG